MNLQNKGQKGRKGWKRGVLLFIDCLLKEVDGGGALFFGGGKFLHEVDKGGEG